MWCKRQSEWHPYIMFPSSGKHNFFRYQLGLERAAGYK
jgi:hypothetical protein